MTTSPTELTLRHLRKTWPLVAVVERWDGHAGIRRDLFGIIDVLAVGPEGTLAVQATSGSNVSARIRKIADSDTIAHIREAGWRIEVHGWTKPGHRWQLRVVEVS